MWRIGRGASEMQSIQEGTHFVRLGSQTCSYTAPWGFFWKEDLGASFLFENRAFNRDRGFE